MLFQPQSVLFLIMLVISEINSIKLNSSKTTITKPKKTIYDLSKSYQLFDNFVRKYNKTYINGDDRKIHYNNFLNNLKDINIHNLKGNTSSHGINKFSDMSRKEFAANYLRSYIPYENNATYYKPSLHSSNSHLPENFDWRDHAGVTEVKNQWHCAACWAFSAIANVESQAAIRLKKKTDLSEQMLIDCFGGGNSCKEGSILHAFESLKSVGGAVSSESYPYEDHQERCRLPHKPVIDTPVSKFYRVRPDEEEMKRIIYDFGPISVGINAEGIMSYSGFIDVPRPGSCNPKELNHAVLVVGYGVQRDGELVLPYWTIKNSWSKDWGHDGFYYLIRGRGACGIHMDASIVDIAQAY